MELILIIEDHEDINAMLAQTLQGEGYQTCSVHTGTEGMKEAESGVYDLILLDLMLPYKSGDMVLKELRAFSQIPVIVISAKDMVGTKIDMLKLGAEDYVTKPFDLGEVTARVESVLRRRRVQEAAEPVYEYQDLRLDSGAKRLYVKGQGLELTAKEYQILELMMANQEKVFSKANLYESIWGEEYLGDDNAVKTHMSNLRSKLKKGNPQQEYIETVWGMGYRLR